MVAPSLHQNRYKKTDMTVGFIFRTSKRFDKQNSLPHLKQLGAPNIPTRSDTASRDYRSAEKYF